MHTIIGMDPQVIAMGMPQAIMLIIMSQHILSMSMLIMPVGIIMHVIPMVLISQLMVGIIAIPQQLIMGMPAHIIMQDVPFFIMVVSMLHMSFIASMLAPSPGVIMHFMPLSVMVHTMRQFIGIIMGMGMGIDIGMVGIALMEFIAALFIRLLQKGVITDDAKLMSFMHSAQVYESLSNYPI